ncbi:hypothetical protein PN836_007645 [Ningiella sp. W23]|uniref:hypothetical protein n=1 Tax=Ningiella sp. W23 TaxID=3023715 RepID=UPI003757FBB7
MTLARTASIKDISKCVSKHRFAKISALTACLLCVFASNAGELDLKTGVSVEYVVQTIDDIDNDTELDSDNVIIQPFLYAGYNARHMDMFLRATHNHVRRSLDEESFTNNYVDLSYGGRVDLVDNLLDLRVRGSQTYRSLFANSFLVDDFLLNAQDLRKINTNQATLSFNRPTGNIIGVRSSLSLSRIKADEPEEPELTPNNAFNINNTNIDGAISVESGIDLRPFLFDISLNARKFERDNFNNTGLQQDFNSELANVRVGSYVSNDVSVRLLGYYENNEITNDDLVGQFDSLREFYSYGVGIAWQPSNNRFIEIGLNSSRTEGGAGDEEDDDDTFISLDMRWAFSSRTQLQGSYSRRFFGDAGRFSLSHTLRNWRSSISYSEQVTTNSQLLLREQDGLLVCSNGIADLANCRLPEPGDEELAPGDVLLPATLPSFELNDQVVLRKSLSAQSTFDLRRSTLVATITRSDNDELDAQREVDTFGGSVRLSIELTPRTILNMNAAYTDIERELQGEATTSIIQQVGIDIKRQISRRFSVNVGYQYLDRSGDAIDPIGGIQGISGPLTDNRISANIQYEFDNNR